MDRTLQDEDGCTAWNPGVRPGIPREFRALETIFRPECVFGKVDEVQELARLTGLPHEELTAFRPRRLALHELIVRVTADIAVAEGEEEEVFGQNFRQAAGRIWDGYILPRIDSVEQAYADLRRQVEATVRDILAETLFRPPVAPVSRPFPFNLLPGWRRPEVPAESAEDREQRVVAGYKTAGLAADDPLLRAIYRSLYRVLGAFSATSGYIVSDRELLVKLVVQHVCNRYGSQVVGNVIAPLVEAAIDREGYTRVRTQAAPILFSLKGASAAGKSSLRPMLKQLMREQGIAPESYVTISPDIWRRFLLDYDSLGPARKYAGYLTSREVALIDEKLDRYVRAKADREGGIPHLMVDRFRFDSFSSERVERVLDATYAKYVDTMYMYFIVTPPEETVERGWRRALERGRYKAVEDFLGHSVEAYVGMPKILFKWLAHRRPVYRYFFLDNMVPKGTFPRIFAFGDQDSMTIYDPLPFIDIERYQKIDTYAASPGEVYPPEAVMAAANNLGFLEECVRRIPLLTFVCPASGVAYLRIEDGKGRVVDAATLALVMADRESAEAIDSLSDVRHSRRVQTIIRGARDFGVSI